MLKGMWMILLSFLPETGKPYSIFVKSDFVKAKVFYLGHVVGHGVATPIKENVKSITDHP